MNLLLQRYGAVLFLGVPMLCYVSQAIWVYAAERRWGMALTMAAYALANIGFILDAKGI